MKDVPKITDLAYRCKVCGFLCTKKTDPELTRKKTKLGDYGSNATPTPASWATDEQYESTTISFTAAAGDDPATISDSANRFTACHFKSGQPIKIATTSATNDGTYTIAAMGVSRGTLTLSSSDSLTTEDAATAGTVTIYAVAYQPSVTTGCPLCGSLASR